MKEKRDKKKEGSVQEGALAGISKNQKLTRELYRVCRDDIRGGGAKKLLK